MVAKLGKAVIDGIRESGVFPVGKHFPGHGDTNRDSHIELPYVNRDTSTLENVELKPFVEAINHGLEVVMTAHVIYSEWDRRLPATFSPYILKTILRERLRFDGLVITDDLEMQAVEKHIPFNLIPKLGSAAEVDLYLICHNQEKIFALQDQMILDIEKGNIDKESVERSVKRITDLKSRIALNLSSKQKLSELTQNHITLFEEMNSYFSYWKIQLQRPKILSTSLLKTLRY